jgi:uncharacterized membrane protein
MKNFFLTLHMLSMCLVVGTLFLQSLSVVLGLRLKSAEEREGLKKTQKRIHKFIYYPILFVTVASGLYLAIKTGVFDKAQWIYPKLGLLLVLVALGFQNGRQIQQDHLPKKYAMMVHIAIFIIAGGMIYLATVKPF